MKTHPGRYFTTLALGILLCLTATLLFAGAVGLSRPSVEANPFGLVFWLGLPLWKAAMIWIAVFIARLKGRRTILWGVIELLSSVIGTLVLIFLPYTRERRMELDADPASHPRFSRTITIMLILLLLDGAVVNAWHEHAVALRGQRQAAEAEYFRLKREEQLKVANEESNRIAQRDADAKRLVDVASRMVIRIDALSKSANDQELAAFMKRWKLNVNPDQSKPTTKEQPVIRTEDEQRIFEMQLKAYEQEFARMASDLYDLAKTNSNAASILKEFGLTIKVQ